MHREEKRNTYHSHSVSPVTRVLAVLLAAFLILTLLSQVIVFAGAIDQETIDSMKEQQAELEAQIADYNEQIAALELQADSAVARYEAITAEIDYLNEQIDLSEALLEQYREETAQEQLQYNNAQLRIEKLTEEYTAAVRAMETQGISVYWSALLNSNSIVEFVQTLNDLQSVAEAQQRVIAEMEEAKADAEAAEEQISELVSQQEDAQELLQLQRKQDEESLAALDEVIAEISANQAVYATQMSELESSKDSLEDDILEAETQLAIEQEAARKAAEEAARKAAEEEAARKAAEEEAARKAAEEAAQKAAEEEAAREAAEEAARKAAEEEQEDEVPAATEPDEEEDNGDTISSVSCTGDDIVAYALQFVGNPYVWGGTSLTNGCDCSGFVMKVYEHFGYSLPHYSGSQARCGIGVSYSDAQPGDIICYSNHVGIYIGNGQMVNAYDEDHGIIICAVSTSRLTAVRRLIY